MFELFFGLFWELITIAVSSAFIYSATTSNEPLPIFLIIFFLVFHIIGLYMLIKGLIKVIKNANTKKFGEETYAFVIDVVPNGSYVNEVPLLNAKTVVYSRNEREVKEIEEYAGKGTSKYNIGDYIKVKYYDGDINFIEKVDESIVPLDIKDKIYRETNKNLPPSASDKPQGPIVYYESEDIVQVDGIRYKRIDNEEK